jgi:hypothetical protein
MHLLTVPNYRPKPSVTKPARRFRALLPPPATLPAPSPQRRPWRFAVFLLLAGFLLFAHGCHGDEDTELRLRPWIEALLVQDKGVIP